MKLFLPLLIALTFPLLAQAQNYVNGAKLHMQSCTGCHDNSIYTRQPRRVNSLPELGKQVRFCKNNLGLTWFDDEVNDVILYLNQDHYRF